MEYGVPIVADTITQDFTDPVVPAFDNTAEVSIGEIRIYDFREYEALKNIYKLATYSWNEISSGGEVTTNLDTKAIVPSNAVPCVINVTIVYVIDSYKDTATPKDSVGKYWKYTGATGSVDFTALLPSTMVDFEEILNYRNEDAIPDVDALSWGDNGAVNSRKLVDNIIGDQTIAPSGTVMVYEFTFSTSAVNILALFNLECTEIQVEMNTYNDSTMLYDIEQYNETFDLIALDEIIDEYSWCFTPTGRVKDRLIVRLPIWFNSRVTVTFTNTSTPPKVGESIFSIVQSVGSTINAPQGTRTNNDQTTVLTSGKRIVKKSKYITDRLEYRVLLNTSSLDYVLTILGKLINENILIIGDETGTFTSAVNYGYFYEIPYEIDSHTDKNIYGITINTLI